MKKNITELDWSVLVASIENYKNSNGCKDNDEAYGLCLVGGLFPNYEGDIRDILVEGSNDCGVDAIKIDRHENGAHIHIFQFKHCRTRKNAETKTFPEGATDKLISFIDRLFEKDKDIEHYANPYLWDKVQEIWDLYQYPQTQISVYLCTNGQKLNGGKKYKLDNFLKEKDIILEEIDFISSLNTLSSRAPSDTEHEFQAIEKQYLSRVDGDIKGLVASIPATSLISLITDPKDGERINTNIFDSNIRVYLGKDNPVNGSIIKSALSEDNSYFWYLNNGITAVCSDFLYKPVSSPIIKIKNLQIVNGAQTTSALFEVYKRKPESLEDIVILFRLYETKDKNLPYDIAIATNSQTRILARDLMSNMDTQVKLEAGFSHFGYFYERKVGQHRHEKQEKRIDSKKLGQLILAYDMRYPEKSKKDSDHIFTSLYSDVFNSDLTIEHLLDIFLTSQVLDNKKETANLQRRKGAVDDVDTFMTYGYYHALYIVALLSEKLGVIISSNKNRESLVEDALNIMRDYVGDVRTKDYYNLFRNPKTKEELYDKVMEKGQIPLPLGLAAIH